MMFHHIFDKLLLGTDIAKLKNISVCLSLNTLPFGCSQYTISDSLKQTEFLLMKFS